MGQNVFLADLHHPGGPDEEIERLLSDLPGDTRRIFLLGDIFHYWVNEDGFIERTYRDFLDRLREWAGKGIQLFFLEGNRDFLASRYFDRMPWIDVIGNPTITEIGGRMVYLGHGDELCWNDWAYQLYKSVVRSAPVRAAADRLPPSVKRGVARRMSDASQKIVASKPAANLEIPHRAYEAIFAEGVDVIVHGHLHQTYQREYKIGGHAGQVFCFGWKDGKRNMIYFEG